MSMAESPLWIRTRGWVKQALRLAGLVAVVVGAVDLFAPYVNGLPAVGELIYATLTAGATPPTSPLAHVLLIAVGAIIAWFV